MRMQVRRLRGVLGNKIVEVEETRECVKCKEILPLHRFDKNERIESGRDVKCRACKYTDLKKYYEHRKDSGSLLL